MEAGQIDGWWIWAHSVIGASHKDQGKPLEDHCEWKTVRDAAIIAAADGHGSDKCPRSDIGAKLATQTAISVLDRFYHDVIQPDPSKISQIYRTAKLRVARTIVSEWRDLVKQDNEGHAEGTPETNQDAKSPKIETHDLWRLYGTTLMAALLTPSFALLCQLGDGAILVVNQDGSVREPVPADPRLLGVETTSLSGTQAEQDFRWSPPILFVPEAPSLLVLCTDGYVNSFETTEGFYQAGKDYLALFGAEGPGYVQSHMEEWLTQTSDKGSADDITIGFMWRQVDTSTAHQVTEKGEADDARNVAEGAAASD